MSKNIYSWGSGKAEGNGSMKDLLGGKGANLAEMSSIGLPVPPGCTLTTTVCAHYYANKRTLPANLEVELKGHIAKLEANLGFTFGTATGFPLLLAVRSGAKDSMPGMMDSILNLGLNDITVVALAEATGNERFAWDCYRRFIQMYGEVVMGVERGDDEDEDPFEHLIESHKETVYKDKPLPHLIQDSALTAEDHKQLVTKFKALILSRSGKEFPTNPWVQLTGAIHAVFNSWMNDRAILYRRKYSLTSVGTAVNIQAMVYGNTGPNSGSGVAFTRNPTNGVNEFYGEYLVNAQGEDVVSGVRTPEPLTSLEKSNPVIYKELLTVRNVLETHFKDVQDLEFTIQDSKLYILQTRAGKRTAQAALKFAVDMVSEGLIDPTTAVLRNPAEQLIQLLAPVFNPTALAATAVLAKGLPAGPGAVSGRIYFNAARALEATKRGEKVLLVRVETSPDDLKGMLESEGILTTRGGVSSHAALIARQMGKVCVCGASALDIDYGARTLNVNNITFKEGEVLSIDGTTGLVYAGEVTILPSEITLGLNGDVSSQKTEKYRNYNCLLTWAKAAATSEPKPEVLKVLAALQKFGA